MTRDLESALSRVTSSADEATAAEAVFAAMAEGYRFARGGGGDAFLVAGYGVEGRGSSRDAAARAWCDGAEAVIASRNALEGILS